jgi:polar amino acid transport system substrate-binding protein
MPIMTEITSAARSELVPNGKLRVGINFGNELLTRRDPVTRAPGGIALDLAWELGRRLATPVEIISYEGAGDLADSATKDEWDVGFLGVEPQRANTISFTAPYVEIDSTYMVQPGSALKNIADVDRNGVRIAVSEKSAYDLYLSRALKHATLVRARGAEAAFQRFVAEKLDALASLKPVLLRLHNAHPDMKILDGRFTAVLQGAGTPKGRAAGAQYLTEYIEDVKANGFVARAIGSNKVEGLRVAPKA